MTEVRITQDSWDRMIERVTEARDYARTAKELAEVNNQEMRALEGVLNSKLNEHGKRINSLERWRAFWTGIAAALGALSGYMLARFKGFTS